MKTRVAILRGINVGGKRKVLMKDLIKLMQDLEFDEATTYIQSGNIIFKSNLPEPEIENKLENAIAEKYGFKVPVIVRSNEELSKAVSANPFLNTKTDRSNLHLTFLKTTPDPELLKELNSKEYDPDSFVAIGKNVFIHCQNKYHQSILSNNFFEKMLGVQATTRNWKTVNKLLELSKSTQKL
ncbi:DUF1697 domain-containing protein [Christiangramia sabulilitoris]|uniref:DUF1697 domain-containing protein n=1 Tax=Christiangramia sabulilitoris TaxID=2583991 RepID=A0A550I792_9FLAO|nr:DUF1697 domain-containing protein [Christiangramia sabulilitoris]TRO66844.1 DUF1697 domain-containing protein [Christiangramia sabulilitoris]